MFVQVVEYSAALKEVNDLLDRKKVLPKRRENLEKAIETVAEAIQYGYVTIGTDGVITQNLIDPVHDKNGNVVLTCITYKSRVTPAEINNRIQGLKNDTYAARVMVYTTLYSGLAAGEIDCLEPSDRAICDGISLFFL